MSPNNSAVQNNSHPILLLQGTESINQKALNNTANMLNLIKQGNATPQVIDTLFQTRYGIIPPSSFFSNTRQGLGIVGFTNFVKWCRDKKKDDNLIQSYFEWGDSFVKEPSNTALIKKMVILYREKKILPIHMFILTSNITNKLRIINNSI